MKVILALAALRFKLLLRQKIGWVSLLVGFGLVLISLPLADVSFVNGMKLFWDLALGIVFVIEMALAIYLGTQIFAEERNRRTLHLLLSSGLSRYQWIVGNVLGFSLALGAMQALWCGLIFATSFTLYRDCYGCLFIQAEILQFLSAVLVFTLGLFSSFWLRPMLALVACSIATFFLYSISSLQRVFSQDIVASRLESTGLYWIFNFARFLPPLEWFDLKNLIGYEPAMNAQLFIGLTCLSLFWIGLLLALCWLRFEDMDV